MHSPLFTSVDATAVTLITLCDSCQGASWKHVLVTLVTSLVRHGEYCRSAPDASTFRRHLHDMLGAARTLRAMIRLMDYANAAQPEHLLQAHNRCDDVISLAYTALRTVDQH